MLNILAVRYQNIFSFGNEIHTIDFTKTGTTLIVGLNGHGKSSGTLDTLCFALYGRPYRDVTKAQVVNCITEKNCLVEVDFTKNGHTYMVRRGMKPLVFEIFKDGNPVDQTDAREYQRHLEEDILGIDIKSFKAVIVIGKADHLPFLRLNAQQRRDVVEDILGLGVFSDMRAIVKAKADANAATLNDVERRLIAVSAELEAERRHVEAAKADNTSRIDTIMGSRQKAKDRVLILQRDIDARQDDIAAHKAGVGDVQALVDDIERYQGMAHQVVAKIDQVGRQIKFYSENANCPTCKHEIPKIEASEHIATDEAKLVVLRQGHEKLVAVINKKKEKRRIAFDVGEKIRILEKEIESLRYDIRMEAREQQANDVELRKLQTAKTVDETSLILLENDEGGLREEKNRVVSEREMIAAAAALLKDSGVKAMVIDRYIPTFNELINKYLDILGLFVGFELDSNFKETIKSRGRDKFTYDSFSEGEKFRIDLAILFAWREIAKMRNSSSANILIFDEILEGSLDHDGKTALLQLLRETENIHIFVISHDTEAYADTFDRTLKFVKKSNFSRIEEMS